MRVVFFGTPELAVPSLASVAKRHAVCAVVTQPDRPQGRGSKLAPTPVKAWALAHHIPVVQPVKLNDGSFEAWLRDQAPEVCALAAYGRILRQAILEIAPHGIINMHPSLLPKYRGPSPIQSAILNGETVTGVSIMRLSMEMDAGDIILQKSVNIEPEDTGTSLTDRLASYGGELLADALDRIASGSATFTPQDHAHATYCRLFEKRDGRIDWGQSAHTIHHLVRAAQPWPVAQCAFRGEVYKVYRTEPHVEPHTEEPGIVLAVARDRIRVATGSGVLDLLEIQTPGKKVVAVADFLRGHAVQAGERFETIS